MEIAKLRSEVYSLITQVCTVQSYWIIVPDSPSYTISVTLQQFDTELLEILAEMISMKWGTHVRAALI